MDVVNTILIWAHFIGLAVGGAAAFGIPVIGSRMPVVAAETRPVLLGIMHALSRVGRIGIGLLLLSGPLLVWLKYGGWEGVSHWFWVKMVLVVLLIVGIIYSSQLLKRLQAGDISAARISPRVGMVNTALLLLIVLTAALAFG